MGGLDLGGRRTSGYVSSGTSSTIDGRVLIMRGAIADGVRVGAVTVFGWDDVLCPTTHAKLERHSQAARAHGVPGSSGDERAAERKQVCRSSLVHILKMLVFGSGYAPTAWCSLHVCQKQRYRGPEELRQWQQILLLAC